MEEYTFKEEDDEIINKQLQPGTYEVNWEASNYPSGVYYYKIIFTIHLDDNLFCKSCKPLVIRWSSCFSLILRNKLRTNPARSKIFKDVIRINQMFKGASKDLP